MPAPHGASMAVQLHLEDPTGLALLLVLGQHISVLPHSPFPPAGQHPRGKDLDFRDPDGLAQKTYDVTVTTLASLARHMAKALGGTAGFLESTTPKLYLQLLHPAPTASLWG